jgi:uncharacterized protein (DUF1697 family)
VFYIAFLRGMNVPGRSVKMDQLRALFTELDFQDVRSYIQSGNVFFDTDETDPAEVAAHISAHLRESLGYEVAVCLRTIAQVEAAIALDPFRDLDVTSAMRCCIVFTTEPIAQDLELPLISPKKDMEILHTSEYEAFVLWHLINGKAPAAKGFQERILGKDATTRYFHTVAEMLEAAKAGGGTRSR